MTKHIAMRCMAIGLLSSLPITLALANPVGGLGGGPFVPENWNAPPAKQTLTKIATPDHRALARPSAADHAAKQHLTKIVPPEHSATPSADAHAPERIVMPRTAPDSQNFIQLAEPEDQPLQNVPVAPTSFSAPDEQPDLADSEVSEDDPS